MSATLICWVWVATRGGAGGVSSVRRPPRPHVEVGSKKSGAAPRWVKRQGWGGAKIPPTTTPRHPRNRHTSIPWSAELSRADRTKPKRGSAEGGRSGHPKGRHTPSLSCAHTCPPLRAHQPKTGKTKHLHTRTHPTEQHPFFSTSYRIDRRVVAVPGAACGGGVT